LYRDVIYFIRLAETAGKKTSHSGAQVPSSVTVLNRQVPHTTLSHKLQSTG